MIDFVLSAAQIEELLDKLGIKLIGIPCNPKNPNNQTKIILREMQIPESTIRKFLHQLGELGDENGALMEELAITHDPPCDCEIVALRDFFLGISRREYGKERLQPDWFAK
jgi:hypothetical protein